MKLYKVYTKEKGLIGTDNYDEISALTLHREDGPAVICYYDDGNLAYEEYFINGKRHRLDGPAYIKYYFNGIIYELYFINDILYAEDQYYKELLKLKVNSL